MATTNENPPAGRADGPLGMSPGKEDNANLSIKPAAMQVNSAATPPNGHDAAADGFPTENSGPDEVPSDFTFGGEHRESAYAEYVEAEPISEDSYFALTEEEKRGVPRDRRGLPIGYWSIWSQDARNRFGRENPRTPNAGPPTDDASTPGKPKRKARSRELSDGGNGATHDDGFVHSEHGQILKGNPDNIRHAIGQLGVTLKHDEFSNQPKIWGLPGYGAGVELTDPIATRLHLLIHETYGFLPSVQLFEHLLIDIAHQNRFHPVRDWLDSKTWDGVPRIDNWLRDYAGAENTAFNRAVGRIFLVAAVRRVRRPGCKFDTMLVLEGPQGRNKSQAIQILAVNPEWFAEHLPLGSDPKVVIEQSRGSWIVECGELRGLATREIERIKAFLSTQRDKARAAYGRRSETVPRQFVAFGTTNDREYLTGDERRFWPVLIKIFDLDALHRDVPQLWAEAAVYETENESITLQEDLWTAAADVRAERTFENPYYPKLAERFGTAEDAEKRDEQRCREGRSKYDDFMKSSDVWAHLGIAPDQQAKARRAVGEALGDLGFDRFICRKKGDPKGCQRDESYYRRGAKP